MGKDFATTQAVTQAVFIERDGILNVVNGANRNGGLPSSLTEFKINAHAADLVRRLKAAGFIVIATTNQPGLSRGTLARRELDAMHELLLRTVPLDDIFVCPHDAADDCSCHKPKPGLLQEAAFKWHVDLSHSFVISDKWQDALAADAANCTSLLLKSPANGKCHHDMVRDSLEAIVETILQESASRKVRVG